MTTTLEISGPVSVNVTATGTTTARLLDDRFAEVSNVRDFGAVGDGAADDTAAIQSALNVTGAVFFPAGSYKVTAPLIVRSNTHIYGEAPESTKVMAAGAGMDAFVFFDGVEPTCRSSIRSMAINAPSHGFKTAGAAIWFSGCQSCEAHDLRIADHFTGIRITSSIQTIISSIHVIGLPETTGVGFLFDGNLGTNNDHYIRDVLVVGNPNARPAAGFRFEQTGATWLDTCGGLWCTNGLVLMPGAGQEVTHLFSTRCAWDSSSSHAMLVAPAAQGKVLRCTFVQDWTASATSGHGLVIAGDGKVEALEFIGHRSINNGLGGAYVTNGVDVRFLGGVFSGNGGTATGSFDGIHIGAGVSRFSIANVRSGQTSEFANLQRYGVFVEGGASDVYTICNNDLSLNLTGGLYDGGSGAEKQVFGNLPLERGFRATETGLSAKTGHAIGIGQTCVVAHEAGNVGSVGLTIEDGGNKSGVFVENIHDGTYSSQRVKIKTAKGGSTVATDRVTVDESGTVAVEDSLWVKGGARFDAVLTLDAGLLADAANDAAAAAAGVAVDQVYRNGSQLMIRVA